MPPKKYTGQYWGGVLDKEAEKEAAAAALAAKKAQTAAAAAALAGIAGGQQPAAVPLPQVQPT